MADEKSHPQGLSRRSMILGVGFAGLSAATSEMLLAPPAFANPTPASFYSAAHLGNTWLMTAGYYNPHHRGVDYNGWPEGTPIPAYRSGIVEFNDWTGIGWCIGLRYPDGMRGGFAHLAARSPLPVGASVARGQSIGPIGGTGAPSTGVHVHCTLHTSSANPWSGSTADPEPYINQYAQELETSIISENILYHIKNTDSTGTFAGWQGTLGVGFIRQHSNIDHANFTALKLPVIEVAGDNQLAALAAAFGIARANIPTNGSHYKLP